MASLMLRWMLAACCALVTRGAIDSLEDLELNYLFDLPIPSGCSTGCYRNGNEAVAPWKPGCPGFSTCEPGFWCNGTHKMTCAAGRYGSAYGLSSADCSGPCAPGHYCPTHYDGAIGLTVGARSPIEKVAAPLSAWSCLRCTR